MYIASMVFGTKYDRLEISNLARESRELLQLKLQFANAEDISVRSIEFSEKLNITFKHIFKMMCLTKL